MKTRTLLFIGSIHSVIVGGYHFALPSIWGWKQATTDLTPSIEWALLVLNFLYSFQMVILGIFALNLLIKRSEAQPMPKLFLGLMALIWLANLTYQLAIPFPAPPNLSFLNTLLPSIAGITFLAFAIPLYRLFNTKNIPHAST